jgi:hypothetical protein
MTKDNNMSKVISEIKSATEEDIKEIIEGWFERTRTDGMKLGAKFIATGVFSAIQKNLNKAKPSLRDYERCVKDIRKIIDVQLTKQNDSNKAKANEVMEEKVDDGTANQDDNTHS